MPNDIAHTGGIGVGGGPSAAEITERALGDASLTRGQAGEAPFAPNITEQGGNQISTLSGGQGTSLIMPGGNIQDSFGQRVFQEERRQPMPETVPSMVQQPQSVASETNRSQAQQPQEQPTQQQPDGRVLMRPQPMSAQAQDESEGFTLSDFDMNPNLADLNIEAPPVVDEVAPVRIGATDFKHTRADRLEYPDIQETASMVQNEKSSIENARSKGDNIAEPYQPTKNVNRLKTKDVAGSTFYESERRTKQVTTQAVANKNWSGNGFTEKVTASRDVDPEDLSIGTQIIAELIREPGNNLIQIVNEATGLNFTLEQLMDPAGFNSFIDAINQSTIYVIGSKSPVPNPSSSQKRRLRVHYGRGVRVHPTQTKIYNLDFDGDGVTVQFRLDGDLFRNAMDYLINEMKEPMIDLDFFPIAQIAESRNDFIRKFRKSFLQRLDDDINTDNLAGALYDIIYPELAPSNKDKRELTIDFIEAMNEVASNYSNRHTVLSYILKDVFDTMLLAKQLQVEMMVQESPDPLSDIIEMPADEVVTMVINEIKYGNLPPNFDDFLIGLHRYIGEVPGKNVMFRLGADVAKRVKFSGETVMGEEGARELYELTLEAGMAAFMSSRANIGEKVAYIQQVARRRIISRVRFPGSMDENGQPLYRNLQDWIDAFVSEYNYFQGLVDAANIEFGCDLDPVYSTIRDHQIVGDTVTIDGVKRTLYKLTKNGDRGDLTQALLSIYGDYTLDKMFPNAFNYVEGLNDGKHFDRYTMSLLARYKRYTLSKLSQDNRIDVNFKEIDKIWSDRITPMYLLMAMADKRKSTASQFNKDLAELTKNFTKVLSEFAKRYSHFDKLKDGNKFKEQADFIAYANDIMSCMHISGPDMFAYYGMDNPAQFINSRYGVLLQKAAGKKEKNTEYVGGVRMTMVIQYRMRNVQNINAEINRLINEESDNLLYTIPRINKLQKQLIDELSILGSSSDLWGVLAQETNGNTSAWDALVESKGSILGKWCDANNVANNFWKKGCKKYSSLMDVMIDPAVPQDVKEAVAADVVRQTTGFVTLQRHEINYQLEIGPHSNYTTISTMAYRDQPNVLSDIQKANNRFKKFFENDWQAMQDDIKQARALYGQTEGRLNAYIKHMADNPQAYMEVSDDIIVDAINAQMDKTSRASEKAHQEIPVAALYNALSEQKGGFTNAIYRSDARVLGMIPEQNLSAYDIIQVLADPSLSFTVYNGSRRYILSREVICGDLSEESLWDTLENNPRLASLLRPGMASVSGGNVYRNAKQGFQESMGTFSTYYNNKAELRGKVKAQLVDRPMFLAMVAMFKPIHGRSSRSVRQETKDVLNNLETLMIGLGKRAANKQPISIKKTLEIMGVSVQSLQEIGGMDEEAAQNWYNDMARCLNVYVAEVAAIIDGYYDGDAKAIYNEASAIRLKFDKSSVALAVDVRQTMTGAKTEKSTEIEGGMTQNNLGLGLWAMSVQDGFTVIDGDMSDEELQQFVGCMTNAGPFVIDDIGPLGVSGNPDRIGSTASERAVNARNALDASAIRQKIEELEDSLPNGVPLVVQMPEWMIRQDATLDPDEDFQISSLGRFLITKRTKAAEDYNLKAKKAGDDGLDSITKTSRYIDGASENIGIVEYIYDQAKDKVQGLFDATMKLAQIMQNADIEEGYNDMDLADYANIASLMIKEISDEATGESTIVIRSLGEISAAIRTNMDQSIVENGTPKEKIANANAIADNVGMEAMIKSEYLRNAALISISSIRSNVSAGSFRPAKKASMSSPERAFDMMWRVTSAESLKLPWGGSTQKPAMRTLPKIRLRAIQKRLMNRIPFDISKSNYNFIGVVGKNKDRQGKILGTDTTESPGQLSVWYLTNNATQDEIDFALRRCYAYGMTLVFKDLSALGNKASFFEKDITPAPFGENILMLPFFDMRLNRSAISGPMAPPSFQYDPSWLWASVEDSQNLYGLGDADALIAGSALNRAQCVAGDTLEINFDDLFYNTRKAYPDMVGEPQLCSTQEILDNIVNWKDDGPTIDFGITDVNPNYNRIMRKLGIQLEEYRRNFSQVSDDDFGFISEGKPDRIVGWVKCYVGNYKKPVYAPIIPWPTGSNLSAPTRFELGDITLDRGRDSIQINWTISEDLEGQYCKVHDGMGAAGKTMVAMSRETDLGKLRHGRSIDMVTAAESFASRRLAWGKRMCTLKTLALTMATPPFGYNYAEHDAAFPDNPEIKERLINERIPIEEWPSIVGNITRFSADPEIDALLREQVSLAIKTGTINPSDILATKFGDQYTFMYVDYDFMFNTDIGFQNALMKWYNSMQPDVCPPNIDSYYDRTDGKGYLFKPLLDVQSEYERGCLQMAVPHKSPVTGNIFYHWENVYLSFSFFNDDYSGLHKVGLNGANRTMEQLNAMAISGKPLEGRNMQLYTENTAAPSFRTFGPNDIELDYGRFLAKER